MLISLFFLLTLFVLKLNLNENTAKHYLKYGCGVDGDPGVVHQRLREARHGQRAGDTFDLSLFLSLALFSLSYSFYLTTLFYFYFSSYFSSLFILLFVSLFSLSYSLKIVLRSFIFPLFFLLSYYLSLSYFTR